MTRKLNMILLTILLLLLTSGCGGDRHPSEQDGTPLTVSPNSATFAALGEKKTFSVISSTDWLARSSQPWLKIVTASGKGGATATQLIISAEENKTDSERSAQFTVSNLGKESVVIDVTQEPRGEGGETQQQGISSAEDLLAFAKAVNGEGSVTPFLVDGVATILNDIDCSSIREWIPIGTESSPLTCSINGNGKKLTNVNWTVDVSKYTHAGFIGYARGIKVSKLTFGNDGDKVTFTGENDTKVRAGGIVGYGQSITLNKVTNNADLVVTGTSCTENNLIVGGLVGYQDQDSTLGGELQSSQGCVNNGDVTASVVARVGGLVGYNSGVITNCTNYGTIRAQKNSTSGPGWLCAYNKARSNVTSNFGYGFVGDTPAMFTNAVFNGVDGFDMESNTVDWTLDEYYDWEELETRQLHSGAVYHHYSCTNVPRHIFVLEVDLTDPGIEITSAFAGDMVPNPNGNKNDNNGFNKRELLSQLCVRKRAEGQNILGGVNCSFFDSNDGFPRGHHVEDGRPLFINNPSVVSKLGNHKWSFTVFADRTASCGVKQFSGKMRAAGKEYNYYSVNDTILRHTSAAYQANLYTSNYVHQPYPGYSNILNNLAPDAMYVVCEFTGEPMKVNTGYASAKVVQIRDGRSGALTDLPFLTKTNQIGIALSGDMADKWSSAVKVGDTVELRCDISIDGDASKPILTLDSTMYQLMSSGADASGTPGPDASLHTKYDPKTFPVVSADRKKVWIVEVDGRQVSTKSWYSLGVKGYEIYRIGKKLGGAWVTGMDGGGSSSMWVWDPSKQTGGLVSRPCDSKGERSCMTYVLIRAK
jgi:hypothetical protein